MMRKTELDLKLQKVYPTAVVDKSLSLQQEVRKLPRFVQEWVVAKFCAEGVTEDNLRKMDEFVREHLPDKRQKDRILAELMQIGKYRLIDEYKVRVDIAKAEYKLAIPSLDQENARILSHIIYDHERLLIDGVWGIGVLEYDRDSKQITMVDFKPLQLSNLDFEAFAEGRSEFATEEWIDILVSTIGLNPDVYNLRAKLVLLSRIIPLVEPNVNMIELGPKQTGKTYLFRNVSYYSRIISGGQVSPAVLFYHLVTKTAGLLATYDCVVFDEISAIKLRYPEEVLGKLKDYMESGHYDRGPKKMASETSIMLVGNLPIKDSRPDRMFYFEVIPSIMRDTSFLDRLNGFIPGWELGKIQQSDLHLTKRLGFAADYFCEILHMLRGMNFQKFIDKNVHFNGIHIRDEKSIKKMASGMLKILFPDGNFTRNELKICMDLAAEYRQRVIDQLHLIAPGEFKKKELKFDIV